MSTDITRLTQEVQELKRMKECRCQRGGPSAESVPLHDISDRDQGPAIYTTGLRDDVVPSANVAGEHTGGRQTAESHLPGALRALGTVNTATGLRLGQQPSPTDMASHHGDAMGPATPRGGLLATPPPDARMALWTDRVGGWVLDDRGEWRMQPGYFQF